MGSKVIWALGRADGDDALLVASAGRLVHVTWPDLRFFRLPTRRLHLSCRSEIPNRCWSCSQRLSLMLILEEKRQHFHAMLRTDHVRHPIISNSLPKITTQAHAEKLAARGWFWLKDIIESPEFTWGGGSEARFDGWKSWSFFLSSVPVTSDQVSISQNASHESLQREISMVLYFSVKFLRKFHIAIWS